MVRVCKKLQVLVTVLIFGLALTLGSGSGAFAGLPDMHAGLHDTAGGHHAANPQDTCAQEPCSEHNADCVAGLVHCSGSGYTAFVGPVEARGLAHSGNPTWTLEGARRLSGVDPLVARHPPRGLA